MARASQDNQDEVLGEIVGQLDAYLHQISGRNLLSADEVVDLLLDMRVVWLKLALEP